MDQEHVENPVVTGIIRDEKGRFPPGVSGHPEGRPEGSVSIIGRLKKIFLEEPKRFEQYCRDILDDPSMRRSVLEQIDSKPRQPIDMDIKLPQTLIDLIKYVAESGANQDISEKD